MKTKPIVLNFTLAYTGTALTIRLCELRAMITDKNASTHLKLKALKEWKCLTNKEFEK